MVLDTDLQDDSGNETEDLRTPYEILMDERSKLRDDIPLIIQDGYCESLMQGYVIVIPGRLPEKVIAPNGKLAVFYYLVRTSPETAEEDYNKLEELANEINYRLIDEYREDLRRDYGDEYVDSMGDFHQVYNARATPEVFSYNALSLNLVSDMVFTNEDKKVERTSVLGYFSKILAQKPITDERNPLYRAVTDILEIKCDD